jgi:hypothetical protein
MAARAQPLIEPIFGVLLLVNRSAAAQMARAPTHTVRDGAPAVGPDNGSLSFSVDEALVLRPPYLCDVALLAGQDRTQPLSRQLPLQYLAGHQGQD